MAIFQPSLVIPDARSGIGLGVVDATQDMTVSWHINGASALTAFSITVYTNDAASTQVYTTGQLTDGCPAYGTTSTGEMQFFSYTIPASDLSAAGMGNGREYKLLITQWWNASDSITQSSASSFVTRETPALSIPPIGTVSTRYYTFTGNYAQAQGDTLNWFRWQIAYASDTSNPVYDTGNVSGTMDVTAYYDGFFAGTDYAVRLTVQTENGVEADTGWVDFSVSYAIPPVTGGVTAGCVGGTDAVLVEWSGIGSIPGEATGPYSINSDNELVLPYLSSIAWSQQGSGQMSFAPPWSIVWKFIPNTTPGGSSRTLLTLTQGNGENVEFRYSWGIDFLYLYVNGTRVQIVDQVAPYATVTVVLTATKLYVRCARMGGGLYPGSSLYPDEALYPATDDTVSATTREYDISYAQGTITSVTLGSPQICNYLEVIKGTASQEIIAAAYETGTYVPGTSAQDYMLADWTDGIDAGTLDVGGDTIIGYTLYRRQGDSAYLVRIAETDAATTRVYDYGALSQQGIYTYYLFPTGASTYIASPVVSGSVMPCWWNWTLMECTETENANVYTVLSAYRFRYNVETGAMSNNSAPNLLENFTPYPTVQPSAQNYKSGQLTALIGAVDWSSGQPEYKDTIQLRDAIYALSTTKNALFLKSRKGELIRIRISGAISMTTADATREQTQTMALPWAEIGTAAGVSLYSTQFAGVQEPEGEYTPQYYVDASDATAGDANIRVDKTAYGADGKLVGTAAVTINNGVVSMPDGMER